MIELFIVMAYIIVILYLTLFPTWTDLQYLFSWGRFTKKEKQQNKDFLDYLTNGKNFTKYQSESARYILGTLDAGGENLMRVQDNRFDCIKALRKTWEWEKGIEYINAKYQRWENNE